MRKISENAESAAGRLIRSMAIGLLFGILFCAVLLAAGAFVMASSGYLPQSAIQPTVTAISAFGAFLGGYAAAKVLKERGLLCGSLAALLLFFVISLAGYAIIGETVTAEGLSRGLLMAVSGAIGGVLAVNKKSRKK